MARTAAKAGPTTKEIPAQSPTADIHHMIRTLAATNSPDQLPNGAITGDMADAQLRAWLEQGFKLHSVERIQAGEVNGIFTLQILYILVKE